MNVNSEVLGLLEKKDWEGIWKLVEQGLLDPNMKIRDKPPQISYWLLSLAVSDAQGEAFALRLIKAGAKADVLQDGNTPLMDATAMRRHELMEALLKAGANVNLKGLDDPGEGGNTPLMIAAENGDLWAVKRLLEAGADVHQKTRRKETALYWGAFGGNVEVVRALLSAGSPIHGNELHWPVFKRNPEVVSLLLDAGCDVNGAFSHNEEELQKGDTPLLVAVRKSIKELCFPERSILSKRRTIAKLLLAKSANPNVLNGKGVSPLSVAVVQKDLGAVKLLLAAGADPDFCPVGKLSPRGIAEKRRMKKILELF